MKNVRTKIIILVTTYVGDDIGEAATPIERKHDAMTEFSLTRVSPVTSRLYTHDVASLHVESMLANSASVIAERISHQIRKAHV